MQAEAPVAPDDAAATPDATMREVDAVADNAAAAPDANDETMQADAADDAAAEDAALVAATQTAAARKAEGNAAFGKGAHEEAESAYAAGLASLDGHDTSGVEPSPTEVEARDLVVSLHVNRAAALLRLERRADAEQACDAALSIQPENVKALYRRGVARAENPLKAIDDLKRALKLEPGNTAAKRELAKAERRRAERERDEQRKMKQGLRKAASLSLYGDKEAEKREKAQRKKRREAAQRERHNACNATRRAEGKEELSFADFEKDEKATRERLAKDRERASEAAAAARRDERRRRSGGDDVVVVDDEGDLARGYKTTDDGRRTSYFSRTPDAEAAKLLAAAATPQRLTGDDVREVTDSDGSAWNAAGTTFEERDMKTWCEETLRRRLRAAAAEASNVTVRATSITKCSGEASLVVSRGRARRIFEFAADIKWEAKLPAEAPPGPGACTITGTLRMPELSSAVADGEYVTHARKDAHSQLSPSRAAALDAAINEFAAAARTAVVAFVGDYAEKKIR
jgi:hypothetical protein